MRFDGGIEELKLRLAPLLEAGEWRVVNPNQHQFRSNNRGVLNWYPSTGNILFQGVAEAAAELELIVTDLLADQSSGPPPSEQLAAREEAISVLSSGDDLEQISFLDDSYSDSELVIGLVGSIGTDLASVTRLLEERLRTFNYAVRQVKVSTDVISLIGSPETSQNEFDRISNYMTEGNRLRFESQDNSILALGVAARINQLRAETEVPRRNAFIVNSLKNPYEVQRLRKIYSSGFYLVGVHADHERRHGYLTRDLGMSDSQASTLIARDADEVEKYGQHTRDTYHLSDFFINYDGNLDSLKMQVWRILDLLFGKPYVTPTFDEYAMFMAFSASLRSADLSRQVGAVLTKDRCIVATGANDVPQAHGGLYWPEVDEDTHEVLDSKDGRDYMRGEDSNAIQKKLIISEIISSIPEHLREEISPFIKRSKIKDITEYGRVVHAEMETLLSAARTGLSTLGTTLYCTTFPCHNCAKHIIAAGIQRVVYVEPYPKSKAQEFHSDSISLRKGDGGVLFEPFIGVGPRSFFDLFSTSLGSGYPVIRKTEEGQIVDWTQANAKLRSQMLPSSYIERELIAAMLLSRYIEGETDEQQ